MQRAFHVYVVETTRWPNVFGCECYAGMFITHATENIGHYLNDLRGVWGNIVFRVEEDKNNLGPVVDLPYTPHDGERLADRVIDLHGVLRQSRQQRGG